jgi:hypothetical protein
VKGYLFLVIGRKLMTVGISQRIAPTQENKGLARFIKNKALGSPDDNELKARL